MNKVIIFLLSFLLYVSLANAQNKKVAITIDDLPFAYNKFSFIEIEEATKLLLEKLKSNNIQATGFVNTKNAYKSDSVDLYVALLEQWLKYGNSLGNHTYSHLSLTQTDLFEYQEDIIRNENILSLLWDKYSITEKYFRYPFLMMGADTLHKNGIERYLQSKNYRIAPVTIDNEDYIFNKIYVEAFLKNDTESMHKTATAYLAYLDSIIKYYDSLATLIANRPINHIFLCHVNLINAHYFNELADIFKTNGFAFITLKEALDDPIYQRKDTLLVKGGWTHTDRWKKNDNIKTNLKYPEIEKSIMDAYSK